MTIVGKHDYVVIVRRWRQQGQRRHAEEWAPAGVVDDLDIATSMAELLEQVAPRTEARVLSGAQLLREFGTEDRERILDLLNSRTTAEVARAATLRQEAIARRAGLSPEERRSGADRRSGRERRQPRSTIAEEMGAVGDRRRATERRSGRERRAA